ncbi:T9SS C-terminal target domain-containing protein [bacterium]|nr:MAG: T9SS C-terminal target domain-containing protein [bacterium]
MNRIILSLVFVFTALPAILFSQTNQDNINACVGTDTISSYYPFTTWWMDGRTEMLFNASEIATAGGAEGIIMSLAFNVKSFDTLTMNGFNIKMLNTVATSINGFTNGGWQVVYSGTYKVTGTGWQTIYFQNPFGWNGDDNILIEVCYNNSRWTWYSFVNASSVSGKTWGQFNDLPNGDGCIDLTSGSAVNYRPNVCFGISPYTGTRNGNSQLPKKYALMQNYPNPFNPTTTIRYEIPSLSSPRILGGDPVTLKVYDVMGREIAILVNEKQSAGTYEVTFDASRYPSGVYYYRMQAGLFSDTKRMILVK